LITSTELSLAYSLDLLLGDPEWLPHPVKLFGYLTQMGETFFRPITKGRKSEFLAGAATTASVISVGWSLGRPRNMFWQVMLAWSALATRSLLKEASAVIAALEQSDIALARQRIARIVGRDTAHLDETEISRALIETLAESTCDGIVAPLFWLAAGGVPAAMAYKALNTMDSMIGHAEPRYLYFGRVAARTDDLANLIPARLTAVGISISAYLLGLDSKSSWRIWLRDGNKHSSPNAGQSEAAMAGALGVRLGGVNVYDGIPHAAPTLNSEAASPSVHAARSAISMVAMVSALALGVALVVLKTRRHRV
jgi:adenosylcobinamide-phosphate synthase